MADRITDLEAENTRLRAEVEKLTAELEKAKEREKKYDDSGRAMLFMLEDIERSRDQVERGKREWEETFDSISDPIFIHDREFKIVRTNRAYADAAGMTFNHFIGKPYYEIFPKMEGPFRMCMKARELQEEEFSCPVTNRIFKVRFYPIKDVNGGYFSSIHILEDITEAKRAEERINEEMDVTSHLLMISEATAHTTDVDRLMEQVVYCVHKIIRCDVCLSYLWDEEAKSFAPGQCYGLSHEMIPLFRTEPLDEKIEFVKMAMEVKEAGFAFSWLPDINTIAVIPLIGKTAYLGLIIGVYKNPPVSPFVKGGVQLIHPLENGGEGGFEFTERDKKIMQGISHQVSTALEQARLYKETVNKSMALSHKVETIQVMNEIDRSILSTLESDEILEIVTRLISRVISCERATVALVDKERKGFIYQAGFGTTIVQKGAFVPFEDTNAADVIKTNRPQYIANLNDIKDIPSLEKKFLNEGFLSHIRVPLVIKEEIKGVLSIGSKRASAFTKEDLATLEKIASQIGVALSNARLVSDLEELFLGTVKSLSSAIDAKSPWTAGHSERVTAHAVKIAKELGFNVKDLKDIELAGLLHDVGKIGTYESILDKPGKLTDEELKIIRQHPQKGAEILEPIKQLKHIIPAIKYHQEFYDGTGYPEGLKGDAIPLMARILGVADIVDAMAADRPYRKGKPMDAVISELKRCSGTQFDPNVVETFLKTVGQR